MLLSFNQIVLPFMAVILIVGPLWLIVRHGVNQKNVKSRLLTQVVLFVAAFLTTIVLQADQFASFAEEATQSSNSNTGLGFLAAAIAVAGSSLGAGWAVASAAPAAIGAVSEDGNNFGRAIIFVALGEGVAIYGLLISILIINKL
ncbi:MULTISPECIES: ATP synthase subunit C [Terrabacteria group]|uniref:ATP synthase subunit C n=1 Tax=Bacillati TaxID=1783272 RepID=UPI001C6DE60C|nr:MULTISPECIES: ATP synthase subunit C [Terrabacteria group]MBW9212316.1 ATP synthase subunit C [Trueperella sp. zg.1013]